jgi:hypothetical protein
MTVRACSLHPNDAGWRVSFHLGRNGMQGSRFDALARSLARHLPRRGLLRTGAAAAALGVFPGTTGRTAAQDAPCNCTGAECDCCLIGITGGGVVRTESGDVNLVLFATELADDATQEAAGFVRWLDPGAEGGLTLESVGPIAYTTPEGEEQLRNVTGIMAINGQDQQPFQLEVFDAGPELVGQDTVRLTVGDGTSGFSYEAAGTVVGGDLQLLSSVAPITSGG